MFDKNYILFTNQYLCTVLYDDIIIIIILLLLLLLLLLYYINGALHSYLDLRQFIDMKL